MGKVIMSGVSKGMTAPSTLPPVGTALNDMSWEDIRKISDAGFAPYYFSVGDRKEVVLNGTVGNFTLSNYTTYAFIIGIDHNAELEGGNRIHFQIGKTALTDGTDIALCDNKWSYAVSETGYFSMNSSNTNSGGWVSSQMRTNICEAMKSVIPAELLAVLKSVTKYTDNTGGGGLAESRVTATTEYFFLLSECEVSGTSTRGNTYESSKQAQYAYYLAGNDAKKYNHTSTSTAVFWWLRSPTRSSTSFVIVDTAGTCYAEDATRSRGFAPAFCV